MDVNQRNAFRHEIRNLSFHPDDVPVLEVYEALELIREILVYEWGWNTNGSHEVTWGDSSTPTQWYLSVGPYNTIEVTVKDGRDLIESVTFKGPWRTITRRALEFLAEEVK